MSEDWDSVTRIGSKARGPGAGGVDRERVVKGKSAINAAARSGAIIGTEKKFASSNTKSSVDGQKLAAIDRNDGITPVNKIDPRVSSAVSRKRNEMKLSQPELAQRCNTTKDYIQKLERGDATPDQKVLNSLERVLNVKLRSKGDPDEIGKPKFPPKKK